MAASVKSDRPSRRGNETRNGGPIIHSSSAAGGTGCPSRSRAYWIEPITPAWGSIRVPSRSKSTSLSAAPTSGRHHELLRRLQIDRNQLAYALLGHGHA